MDIRQKVLGHRVSESWNGQTGAAERKKKTKQNPNLSIKQIEVRQVKLMKGLSLFFTAFAAFERVRAVN